MYQDAHDLLIREGVPSDTFNEQRARLPETRIRQGVPRFPG
jgi:hypothetical protein